MTLIARAATASACLLFCMHSYRSNALAAGEPNTPLQMKRNIPYAQPENPRQMLDVYAPVEGQGLPVVVWIHGGGWQTGDKGDMASKPQAFIDQGFVFVAVNYRLLPKVEMGDIVRDIAKSVRWVHDHAAEYGGDPDQILLMGHSAGAQLAALVSTDERYLKAEGLALGILKGCVPVDGDTYDIPLQIDTAAARRKKLGQPDPKFGHREKFGHTPERHRDFSAVNHIAVGKGIPPFLILHVDVHEDTTAQAKRLHEALTAAGIPSQTFGAKDTDHVKLNHRLGETADPATAALFEFLRPLMKNRKL